MILKGYHNDHFGHIMIPSPSIDLVWGTHISDVLSYRQLCQLIKENFGTSLSDHIGGKLFRRDCRLIKDYGDNFCRLRSNDGGGKVVANGYSYGPKNCRYSKKESTTN